MLCPAHPSPIQINMYHILGVKENIKINGRDTRLINQCDFLSWEEGIVDTMVFFVCKYFRF